MCLLALNRVGCPLCRLVRFCLRVEITHVTFYEFHHVTLQSKDKPYTQVINVASPLIEKRISCDLKSNTSFKLRMPQ